MRRNIGFAARANGMPHLASSGGDCSGECSIDRQVCCTGVF
jgi:hypothetical protein